MKIDAVVLGIIVDSIVWFIGVVLKLVYLLVTQ
jgi:hypothetical protein